MGPEQTKLMDRLFGDLNRSIRNFNIFRGDKPCTAEELCAQINAALDQVARGEAQPSRHPPQSDTPQIDVRDFVRNLPILD